jgi:alkanesulfonate monooxygenase SsuD/methylene tetrahydromethanopterin reductase-like flavin-dependent oxidoreductase (luciferase family)
VTLAGGYDRVRDAVVRPPPDRPIPLLVAAKGRRRLRLTARYADAWTTAWFGLPDDLLRRRLAELNAALEAAGRDPGHAAADGRWRVGASCSNAKAHVSQAGRVSRLQR